MSFMKREYIFSYERGTYMSCFYNALQNVCLALRESKKSRCNLCLCFNLAPNASRLWAPGRIEPERGRGTCHEVPAVGNPSGGG